MRAKKEKEEGKRDRQLGSNPLGTTHASQTDDPSTFEYSATPALGDGSTSLGSKMLNASAAVLKLGYPTSNLNPPVGDRAAAAADRSTALLRDVLQAGLFELKGAPHGITTVEAKAAASAAAARERADEMRERHLEEQARKREEHTARMRESNMNPADKRRRAAEADKTARIIR